MIGRIVTRRFSSALYITADKAQDHFVLLIPHLDFEERLLNRPQLERNLEHRGVKVDLPQIERRWLLFRYLDGQRVTLETAKSELGKQISDQLKNGGDSEHLKLRFKVVKDDLKVLKEHLYGIEESAALAVLSLPNTLHPKTPETDERLLCEHLPRPLPAFRSHLEIAPDLIKLINPNFYYLRGDAARFEYALTNFASNTLTEFTPISNSDFCRSVIVEGCGTESVFTLDDQHTHLVGGASLYAFMAYFTKHVVTKSKLPLRLLTIGQQYQPNSKNVPNLFGVNQESTLAFFIAVKDDDEEMEIEFDGAISKIVSIYKALGYHFRLVYVPARNLKNHESLRVAIQMFSSYTQTYVDVGHCSIIDKFLSKRLLFTYNVDKEKKFVRIISGTLMRVPPILACVLENNGRSDTLLSDMLRNYL